MFLRELVIRRKDTWEDKSRPLHGYIRVENAQGTELKILLSENAAARIVNLCAEGLVEASRDVAALIAEDMANQQTLPYKADDKAN